MMKKTSFEDALILNAIKSARYFLRVLPLPWCLSFARAFGAWAYFFSSRKSIAYKNLRMAFGHEKTPAQLRAIAKESMQKLAMTPVDLLKIPEMNTAYIDENVEIHGIEKFDSYVRNGQGIIYLTAHFGSWEMLNITASLKGYPMVALARVQKHPRADAYLNSLRASKGSQVIFKGMPIREILKALKQGRIVGMLSDQDGGRAGCFVKLFGRYSSTPNGVAKFSLRTGAPIFPSFIFREKGLKCRIEIEGPLAFPPESSDPEEAYRFILQQFVDILESKIRKSPSEWLWAHRRWKSSPDRSILILDDGKAGHLNQSRQLALSIQKEMLAKGRPEDAFHCRTVRVVFKSRAARILLRVLGAVTGGWLPCRETLMKRTLTPESFDALIHSYADIVVSAGDSLQEVNLMIARENVAKSVVLMKPHLAPKHFQAVIVPSHDAVKASSNIFVTQGAVSVANASLIEKEAKALQAELGLEPAAKHIGVLIGGDTDRSPMESAVLQQVLGQLEAGCDLSGARLLVTTSRRTPSWAETQIKKSFASNARCRLLVIANEKNRAGVVPAILGCSDVLVVSGESMSMVSEALASGRPVLVFMPSTQTPMKKKYARFLEEAERAGQLQRIQPQALAATIQARLERKTPSVSPEAGAANENVLREAALRVL